MDRSQSLGPVFGYLTDSDWGLHKLLVIKARECVFHKKKK